MRRLALVRLLSALGPALTLASGCGNSFSAGAGGDGGDGIDHSKPYVDDAGNTIYPTVDAGPIMGPTCGAQTEAIGTQKVVTPPDVLIVLDKSGSMSKPVAGGAAGATRWSSVVGALTQVTLAQQANVKFGLSLYPKDNMCGINPAPAVGVDLNTAGAITLALLASSPGGNTPTPDALAAAKAYFDARTPVNPAGRYVLLSTDGEPNCGVGSADTINQSLQAITALSAAGIKTFVIGVVGDFTSAGNQFLDDAASAGGTARAGMTKYYPATNQADLQSALTTIAGSVMMPSCTFALAKAPPVPDNVSVSLGGTPVGRSTAHTQGWDYAPDPTHITFYGTACATITSGGAANVSFVYGCPGPKIN